MSEYINKQDALYATDVGRDNWTSPNNAEAWWACGEMKDAIRKTIESLPAVDAEPVRHGRWIGDEFGSRCGVCGLYAYRDKFDKPWESPYCPNCGAKMDGE